MLLHAAVAREGLGQTTVNADFARDRGLLIAKGTVLSRGEGYVAALVPGTIGATYGLTSQVTVVGGIVPWTLSYGTLATFVSLRLGVVQRPELQVAVGGFALGLFDGGEPAGAGWPFITATVGSGRLSATGLLGVGSSTQILDAEFDGAVLAQGMVEALVARGVTLIAEGGWLGRDSDVLLGGGVRLFGSRWLVELGAGVAMSERPNALPWAAVAFRW